MVIVRLLALSLLVACGRGPWLADIWPVTPTIASKSTHRITGARSGMSDVEGMAWLVSQHHLVTAASVCNGDPNSLTLHARGVRYPVEIAHYDGVLCLVWVPVRIVDSDGDWEWPLLVARSMPKVGARVSSQYANGTLITRNEISIPWNPNYGGMPVHDGCGVLGIMAGPPVGGGAGSRIVTSRELKGFLYASLGAPGPGAQWGLEPIPPDGIPMMFGASDASEKMQKHYEAEEQPEDLMYGRGGCR